MGTTALRQLLKSLCYNSYWKYAVLWKLRHGNPMILTWEDGYFDYPKPRETVESISDGVCCNGVSDISSLQFVTSTSNGSSGGCQIGLAVAEMSCLEYAFGEGVVGEVAFTGNHCWVSFNNVFIGEVNPKLVPECPQEWLLQFASGIKTILLVPVLPHGVLQLGSLEEVVEDIEIVAYVKGRFNGFNGETALPITLSTDLNVQLSSSLISSPIEYSHAASTIAISLVKPEDTNHLMAINSVKLDKSNLPEAFIHESKNKTDIPPVGLTEVSTSSESIDASQLEMLESKLFEPSCLMEELQAYSDCNEYNMGLFGDAFHLIMDTYPAGDMVGQPSGGKAAIDMNHKNVSSFLSFPKDSELHKALGPAFWRQNNELDSSFLVKDNCSSSNLICSNDKSDRANHSWIARGGDAGYLLEAVVANAHSGSDDTFSYRSNSFKSSTRSSGHFAALSRPQNHSEASTLVGDDSVPWSHVTSSCISEGRNSDTISAALKSMMSAIFDEEQQERGYNHMQPRKGQKVSNASRRRVRPGDNQRPRPRDRQLIQDRVKELRELVPDGAKCSIDGLLDRTIKHMLYLRNVTDQAEKLRQWVHQEVAARKNWRSSEIKDNSQHGTSWAYEFGNELQVCPIVVEDLEYPGHLLIEMLCNDHGLFLEIAQVIRGLELTILKGVMESRSNNTWAHFIIEASKGFHRLDIFWPLMQLLQRKRNPISSKI